MKKMITLCFLNCFFFFSQGQELVEDDLIKYVQAYNLLNTTEEKSNHLADYEVSKLTSLTEEACLNILCDEMQESCNGALRHYFIAEYYRRKYNYDKAKYFYENALGLLFKEEKIDLSLRSTIYLHYSGTHFFKNVDYNNIIQLLNKGLADALSINNEMLLTKYYSNLSFVYPYVNDYQRAIKFARLENKIAKKNRDTTAIIRSFSNISGGLSLLGQHDKAIEVYNDIEKLLEFKNLPDFTRSVTLLNVGQTYFQAKEYELAYNYFLRANKLDIELNTAFRIPSSNFRLGTVLTELEQYQEADVLLTSALQYARKKNNTQLLVRSCLSLARLNTLRGSNNKTVAYLEEAYKQSHKINKDTKAEIEINLANYYENIGELTDALSYRKKAKINSTDFKQQNFEYEMSMASIELEIDKLIKTNEQLESSNDTLNNQVFNNKKVKNILIGSFALGVLLITLFLYHKNQKEKLRTSQYKEQLSNKERIAIEAELNTIRSQMNPHFMFNSLNSINEYIQNDSGEAASNYLVKFSRLMRFTLNYSKRKFVTLEEELELLKLYIELENLRFYNSIDFSLTINPTINMDTLLLPPMMIQPFVENAIWHGLMAKAEDRKLSLSFSESEYNIICEIEDNGIGRAASEKQKKPNHKSQGIGLTQRRLELLKNIHGKEACVTITDLIENEKVMGTLVKVVLPKKVTS